MLLDAKSRKRYKRSDNLNSKKKKSPSGAKFEPRLHINRHNVGIALAFGDLIPN